MNNAERVVNVGILGYGPVSAARTFHVPLISFTPGLRLHTVATQTVVETQKLIDDDSVHITESLEEVIVNTAIELVIIALPNTMHFEYARKCLEAGKHVVVEKPMCLSAAEVTELGAIAQKQRRVLLQFHNRRFDGGFLTVQKVLAEGRCGIPRLFEMNYDRWTPEIAHGTWRESDQPGSGTFYDLGVHLIDQTLCLFGTPLSVRAQMYTERPGTKAVDAFDMTLAYADHRVLLRSSLLASQPAPRYRLVGTAGNYVKYGIDPQAGQLNDGILPNDKAYGRDKPEHYGLHTINELPARPLPTEPGCYQVFYSNLVAHLLRGEALGLSVLDAHNIIAIVEAAYRSSAEQRTIAAKELHLMMK